MCNVPTCASQFSRQFSIFAALQRGHPLATLLLVASFALEATRWVGCRGQLERKGGLARVPGPALHARGEYYVGWALDLCEKE